MWLKRTLVQHWAIFVLLFVAFILCFKNYTPGTFLSGWDTLHPEFNFELNFERLLFGVFRPEQGVGSVAAHSHMADLPRVLSLYLLHFIIPQSFLRYAYIFFCLFSGPVGMYFFLRRIVFTNQNVLHYHQAPSEIIFKEPEADLANSIFSLEKAASFSGALFYLLNVGTMQQFIVPFEMFTTLYAFLPWLFLFTTKYFYEELPAKRKLYLLLFSFITLLLTPSAYAATLWYGHFFLFCLYLFSLSILDIWFEKRKRLVSLLRRLKRVSVLLLFTLFLNSFWLLPNVYFVITHSANVANARINQMFSPQAFLHNKAFGDLKDIIFLKSFLFDWAVYSDHNSFQALLQIWIKHLESPFIILIASAIFFVTCTGLFLGIKQRSKVALSFLPMFAACLFFLMNDNGLTAPLFRGLQQTLPVFKEAFRFPHTKFYIQFIFMYAVLFAYGQAYIVHYLINVGRPFFRRGTIGSFHTCLTIVLLIFYIYPAFSGYFIHPAVRVTLPVEYFQLFDWLNKQNDFGRIANLPIHSFWGWEYHELQTDKPGFQGAGLLWFGIKQPFFARDFDRWNPTNEQYYREMSYAIYTNNSERLKNVLRKYQIKYILIDSSVVAPQYPKDITWQKEAQKLFASQKYLTKSAQFGNFLSVYTVSFPVLESSLTDRPTIINPGQTTAYEDTVFTKYDIYRSPLANEINGNAILYPFQKSIRYDSSLLENTVTIRNNSIELPLPSLPKGGLIPYESYINYESTMPAIISAGLENNQIAIYLSPQLSLNTSENTVQPLVINFPSDTTEHALISINHAETFKMTQLKENEKSTLGTLMINTKSENTLELYNHEQSVLKLPDFTSLTYVLEPCDSNFPKANYVLQVNQQKNGFSILGKTVTLCLTVPLRNLIPPELSSEKGLLLSVNLNYLPSINSLPASLCIADLVTGNCRENIFPLTASSFTIPVDLRLSSKQGLRFMFDFTHTKEREKATLSNIKLSFEKPVAAAVIPSGAFKTIINNESKKDLIKTSLTLPIYRTDETHQPLINFPQQSTKCENLQFITRGEGKRQIIKKNTSFIHYEVEDGLLCDHFSYSNLSHSSGYLVSITSRNISGLPLTLCLSNYSTKRCEIYAYLSGQKNFATKTFLLPPTNELLESSTTSLGYDINIGSLGIHGSPAINDLASINIFPFPYNWLNNLAISSPNINTSTNTTTQPIVLQKLSPSLFTATNLSMDRMNLLSLQYSYDEGWKAYVLNNNSGLWLKAWLPFIFGSELKTHVLVDGWANGWKLPDNLKTNGSSMVFIFLPQYLQFIGTLLLLITEVYLLKKFFINTRRKNSTD